MRIESYREEFAETIRSERLEETRATCGNEWRPARCSARLSAHAACWSVKAAARGAGSLPSMTCVLSGRC
jgi:hypothetical protein